MSEATDPKTSVDEVAPVETPAGSRADSPGAALESLMALVARLRAPDGCPWDREQTLDSVRAYLLEEAHELAAAIDEDDGEDDGGALVEELGDLLFQGVFIARLGEEAGRFDLAQALRGIEAKMIERHPHVFGSDRLADATSVRGAWERRKAAAKPADRSLLAGVPGSLPALTAAYRLTQKAAGVGFDWPDVDGVLDKIHEELGEVQTALTDHRATPDAESEAAVRDEVGDLLFAVANLARHLDLDPEAALAQTNGKFRRRFAAIETSLAAQGGDLAEAGLEILDREWERAKADERQG